MFFKSHGMFDFAYKLQLYYNIYKLVFTITGVGSETCA